MPEINDSPKEQEVSDRRKTWLLGLSREGWISIVTALLTFAFGYGMLSERVSGNERNLGIFKTDMVKYLDDFKSDNKADKAELKADINQIRIDQKELIMLIKSRE